MNTLPPLNVMEQALTERDSAFDGVFYICVRSTGIFCRPSCRSRTTLKKNRVYLSTAGEALRAGYRACKRCRPLDTNGLAPPWLAELLTAIDTDPLTRRSDWTLRQQGLDPSRVRRYFVKHFGMTFQAYMRGRRMTAAMKEIRNGTKLDDVAPDIGYESLSGFRDAFTKTFGQPPGQARASGSVATTWIASPLGPLLAGAVDDGICLLEFSDRRMLETQLATLRRRFNRAVVPGQHPLLEQLADELRRYFAGELRQFTVPLVAPGTAFQMKVWQRLRDIPYGATLSYEALASEAGAPGAQRAAGTANGKNRMAIVIPCHRVVNKSGQLGGYGGGLWRKQFLLDLERRVVEAGSETHLSLA